jgi:monoamine oxidase
MFDRFDLWQLLYKTRFWEHIEDPIFGGCGSTDLPGIGSVCYPAYNINGTGPGAMLASYTTPTGPSLQAMSEADHVGMVVEAMNEIHGDIAAEQYTGEYDRVCWGLDPHQAGSWASPYARSFTEADVNDFIFSVGEHTSQVHAWIWSAQESAVSFLIGGRRNFARARLPPWLPIQGAGLSKDLSLSLYRSEELCKCF